jgi:flagellar protein FlaF
MNATLHAFSAYGRASTPMRTDRGIEFEVFAQVTRAISAASKGGRDSFPELALALHTNRRLWIAVAVDVSDPDNELPEKLRAQIFYLSEFVNVHTREVLSNHASIDALLEVNMFVMRGLNSEG